MNLNQRIKPYRCTKTLKLNCEENDLYNQCHFSLDYVINSQELHERQVERHRVKEEEEAHVVRSREECDKAFRE